MLYICVYIYIVTIMGLKDHCLVSRYIHRLMLHVMNDYYMTKCAELKDCKMGGFVNQKNKNKFTSGGSQSFCFPNKTIQDNIAFSISVFNGIIGHHFYLT